MREQAVYEEFPLAKTRLAAKIDLEKLRIEYMVVAYKKAEMTTIIRQRRRIDWIRTRCKIVELAATMLEYLRLDGKLTRLERSVDRRRGELRSIEAKVPRRRLVTRTRFFSLRTRVV